MPATTVRNAAFLAIVIVFLQFHASRSTTNFSLPIVSPLFGSACRENVCGMGTCVFSSNNTFGFECECEPGWRQARDEDDNLLKFLPCIFPNCTLNYTCPEVPGPQERRRQYREPEFPTRTNYSFLDPCFFANCGGGVCYSNNAFTYTCGCYEGYRNLFNASAFPCYSQCAFGQECQSFQLALANESTAIPFLTPFIPNDGERSIMAGLVTMAMTSLAIIAAWNNNY